MYLAGILHPIAFQASGKIIPLDLFLRIIRWGHASNSVRRCSCNNKLCSQVVSSIPISCSSRHLLRRFWQNGLSFKKGSLGRDMPSAGDSIWQAASALLGLASLPSTSWCGLCQQSDWALFWLGARVHAPRYCCWSLWTCGPSSATSHTLGSLRGIFCHQWLACSDA